MARQGTDSGEGRRAELLAGTVAYVLEQGVTALSLRPLAAALGTSDRMLLYYFGTREALLAAVLEDVAERLKALLAAALPDHRLPPAALLGAALTAASDAGAARALRLWLEVIGLAASGDPAYTATTRTVLQTWIDWLADRVDVPPPQRRPAAAALLAVIDGLVIQHTVASLDEADTTAAATWVMGALPR